MANMAELLMARLDSLGARRLETATAIVVEELARGRGVRIGESSVLSTKVHSFNAQTPEHVQIMVGADAGQFFYRRQYSGRVGHVDVFHQCGKVDHCIAAQYIRRAVALYEQRLGGSVSTNLIDIQTATGGGRITGTLKGGNKSSLRRVHENHIHLAFSMPVSEYCCVFYMVAAIETAIEESGLQLRQNERISYIETVRSQDNDLSPYTDESDSMLKEPKLSDSTVANTSAPNSNSPLCCTPPTKDESNSAGLTSGQTLTAITEKLNNASKSNEKADQSNVLAPYLYAPGLALSVKQALASIKGDNSSPPNIYKHSLVQTAAIKRGSSRSSGSSGSSGLDLTATIGAAAQRMIAGTGGRQLVINAADLRFSTCRQKRGYDISLLIDTSASMTGNRLTAAKFLAGEVIRHGGGRISLITFQSNRSQVILPFANSCSAVLQAFDQMAPGGSTPLALGLKHSRDYINANTGKKALLVLITDGIPSLSCGEMANPVTDALAAANDIKQLNCGFLCIGLEDTDGFLQKLTRTAGGVLYVFTEYERQAFAQS